MSAQARYCFWQHTAIEHVTDPVVVWKNFRRRLLDINGLTLLQTIEAEDAYVRSCISSSITKPEEEIRKSLKKKASASILKPVEEFVTSPVFKIAVELSRVYLGNPSP